MLGAAFIPHTLQGVYHGTYRGNTFGYDLNRSWRTPTSTRQPTVAAVKNFLSKVRPARGPSHAPATARRFL